MTAQILGELFNRNVPSPGLLAKSHHHDIVEVAAKPLTEFLDRSVSYRGGCIRTLWRRLRAFAAALKCANRKAGFLRFQFAYRVRKFLGITFCHSIWALPGKQFVEHHTKRIDVARCRDYLTAYLFWAGISRG